MEKSTFAYALGQNVKLTLSDEAGEIIARAEYTNKPPQYLVRYKSADGRQVECWWEADALIAA